jgi:hypothetical protein
MVDKVLHLHTRKRENCCYIPTTKKAFTEAPFPISLGLKDTYLIISSKLENKSFYRSL